MNDDELAWEVNGLCGEVVGGTPKTVPSWERAVRMPLAEMVEGELSQGKQFRPTVRGKGNVGEG